jgi:hypothetical protein
VIESESKWYCSVTHDLLDRFQEFQVTRVTTCEGSSRGRGPTALILDVAPQIVTPLARWCPARIRRAQQLHLGHANIGKCCETTARREATVNRNLQGSHPTCSDILCTPSVLTASKARHVEKHRQSASDTTLPAGRGVRERLRVLQEHGT